MKVYSLTTMKNEPFIGVEMEGILYHFTRAWEIFKDIQTSGRGPQLPFMQLMFEYDYFYSNTFAEVFEVIGKLYPVSELRVAEEFNYALPISRPSKIICLGRNYSEHARESGAEPPKEPIIFAKAPTALIPHQGTIFLNKGIGRVDHEAELALVIGKEAHRIPAEKAMDYVAGYTIMNDVTAREMQKRDIKAGHPWFLSKSLDTYGPMGPGVVPRDAIKDSNNLDITLKLSGTVQQNANTREMIFKIPEIIAYISRFMTLNAGDIISTGTPSGVSPLADGDIIEIEISEIGLLRNFVVDATAI